MGGTESFEGDFQKNGGVPHFWHLLKPWLLKSFRDYCEGGISKYWKMGESPIFGTNWIPGYRNRLGITALAGSKSKEKVLPQGAKARSGSTVLSKSHRHVSGRCGVWMEEKSLWALPRTQSTRVAVTKRRPKLRLHGEGQHRGKKQCEVHGGHLPWKGCHPLREVSMLSLRIKWYAPGPIANFSHRALCVLSRILNYRYAGVWNGRQFARMVRRKFPAALARSSNPQTKRILQDGCPVQNSAKGRRALARIGAMIFKIPARSPDLNPIENLFSQVLIYSSLIGNLDFTIANTNIRVPFLTSFVHFDSKFRNAGFRRARNQYFSGSNLDIYA